MNKKLMILAAGLVLACTTMAAPGRAPQPAHHGWHGRRHWSPPPPPPPPPFHHHHGCPPPPPPPPPPPHYWR